MMRTIRASDGSLNFVEFSEGGGKLQSPYGLLPFTPSLAPV